jgi:hypothetical protein
MLVAGRWHSGDLTVVEFQFRFALNVGCQAEFARFPVYNRKVRTIK